MSSRYYEDDGKYESSDHPNPSLQNHTKRISSASSQNTNNNNNITQQQYNGDKPHDGEFNWSQVDHHKEAEYRPHHQDHYHNHSSSSSGGSNGGGGINDQHHHGDMMAHGQQSALSHHGSSNSSNHSQHNNNNNNNNNHRPLLRGSYQLNSTPYYIGRTPNNIYSTPMHYYKQNTNGGGGSTTTTTTTNKAGTPKTPALTPSSMNPNQNPPTINEPLAIVQQQPYPFKNVSRTDHRNIPLEHEIIPHDTTQHQQHQQQYQNDQSSQGQTVGQQPHQQQHAPGIGLGGILLNTPNNNQSSSATVDTRSRSMSNDRSVPDDDAVANVQHHNRHQNTKKTNMVFHNHYHRDDTAVDDDLKQQEQQLHNKSHDIGAQSHSVADAYIQKQRRKSATQLFDNIPVDATPSGSQKLLYQKKPHEIVPQLEQRDDIDAINNGEYYDDLIATDDGSDNDNHHDDDQRDNVHVDDTNARQTSNNDDSPNEDVIASRYQLYRLPSRRSSVASNRSLHNKDSSANKSNNNPHNNKDNNNNNNNKDGSDSPLVINNINEPASQRPDISSHRRRSLDISSGTADHVVMDDRKPGGYHDIAKAPMNEDLLYQKFRNPNYVSDVNYFRTTSYGFAKALTARQARRHFWWRKKMEETARQKEILRNSLLNNDNNEKDDHEKDNNEENNHEENNHEEDINNNHNEKDNEKDPDGNNDEQQL